LKSPLGAVLAILGFLPFLMLVGALCASAVLGLKRAWIEMKDGHYFLALVILFIVAWWAFLAGLCVLAFTEWAWRQISN
jgi:hypothetical protein